MFRDSQTLTYFFRYPDQRCLALYMQEALRFRAHILQPPIKPDPTQRIMTFFRVLPSDRGTERTLNTVSHPDSRPMRIRGTSPHHTRPQQLNHLRPFIRPTNFMEFFLVLFSQSRMLGEMGQILFVRAFHILYLLCSCIVPFIFMHCIFYRRPFGSPTFYGHHCTQQSL